MGKRRFHWDPIDDCVIMETDENADTIVTYTHEPGQFGPLLSENRGGTESYHHYDALGSTTMLTDDTGTVTDTFQYDAWGNQVARTGTTPTPYQWVGRWGYQSGVTAGIYYCRERAYDSIVSRWSSPDPLWVIEDGTVYTYTSWQPVLLVDPSGLTWHPTSGLTSFIFWMSDATGDTLKDLADIVSHDISDSVCIWPVTIDKFQGTYPATNAPCAVADTSNLWASQGGKLALYQSRTPATNDDALEALKAVFGSFQDNQSFPTNRGDKAASQIGVYANWGGSPIELLVVGGHSDQGVRSASDIGSKTGKGLKASSFFAAWQRHGGPTDDNSQNKLNLASQRQGPPKCWFTKNATIYGFGCLTSGQWAPDVSVSVARKGVVVYGSDRKTQGQLVPAPPWLSLLDTESVPANRQYRDIPSLLGDGDWTGYDGQQ